MEKKYLILPVNDSKNSKKYIIKNDSEKLLFDFDSSIDFDNPVFYAYLDITRFFDCNLRVESENGEEVHFSTSCNFPSANEICNYGYLRPVIHFTPMIGWMNDPNGMVFMNGMYHLFFQHNPCSRNWGNMTWGHAVSSDLLHWKEIGDSIFPDEMGTVFSGSAVCDYNNAAGFGKNVMICFYTAAGDTSLISKGKQFTQCIAFSKDNGETFTKYERNPYLSWIKGGNRDPKVEWCEELDKYVMALYLDGSDFELFTSDDLRNWEHWEYLTLKDDNECPAFYPLEIDGERKWVFQGAHDTYVIGTIENGRLCICQEEQRYHIGNISYAPQSFFGTDSRRIRIAWLQSNVDGTVFNSQAGIPTEFFLKRVNGIIRLGSLPVRELESICIDRYEKRTSIETSFEYFPECDLEDCGVDLSVKFHSECSSFSISCFGTKISVDPSKNEYRHGDVVAPLSYSGDMNIRIVFDTLTAEIFADGGLVYSTFKSVADRKRGLLITASKPVELDVRIDILKL